MITNERREGRNQKRNFTVENLAVGISPAKAQRPPSVNKITNSKLEIRNSNQFQMVKDRKILNKPVSDLVIGKFLSLFRISIFGFRILFRRHLGAIK